MAWIATLLTAVRESIAEQSRLQRLEVLLNRIVDESGLDVVEIEIVDQADGQETRWQFTPRRGELTRTRGNGLSDLG